MLTTGCSWCSTATTCSPLGSVWIWYGGNLTSRAGSGRGGRSVGQLRVWATPAPPEGSTRQRHHSRAQQADGNHALSPQAPPRNR